MVRKETLAEKLEKIAQEYERKLPAGEWVKERLRWEDWETLSKEAVAFAAEVLDRRRKGQVRAGGYDAESIAAQAIADLLEGKGRMAPGWTRARLVKELERLIRGRIRLLDMLKESSVTVRDWTPNADGEEASVVKDVPDECADGYEALAAREAEEEREQMKRRVEELLAGEPELAGVFECRWHGITNPAEMAERLGMDEAAVIRARKRLDRRLAGLRGSRLKVRRPAS